MTVKFHYSYRDASNYKEFGEVLFEGELAEGDVGLITDAANEDGDGFVASQVGLEPLQPHMERWGRFPNPDDHGSSEIPRPPEDTDAEGVTDPRPWRQFVAEFVAMKGKWDPVKECELLGIDLFAEWDDNDGEGEEDE